VTSHRPQAAESAAQTAWFGDAEARLSPRLFGCCFALAVPAGDAATVQILECSLAVFSPPLLADWSPIAAARTVDLAPARC